MREETESLDVFQSFTDLMSNAFLIMSFFLLLIFVQIIKVNKDLKDAAPIIIDQGVVKYSFSSGSAELKPELREYITKTVAPSIEKTLQEHNIDFIQVIGHTDGQGIHQPSNLDQLLIDAANRNIPITTLKAGSNADLGLMRAVAVVQELLQVESLKGVSFRAYSAGQLYLPQGKLASDNRSSEATRRRIEIRFIPYGKTTN